MEKDYWIIIFSAVFFGLTIPGGQFFSNLGFSLYEISVYTLLLLFFVTLPIIIIKKKFLLRRSNIIFFLIYGLIGALLQLTQYGGIVFGTPVAVVALLIYTQPIWTTFFGKVFLNEKITKVKIKAVFVAFLGLFFLLSPWNIKSLGNLQGVISSLFAGVFLSLWVIFARKTGINKDYYISTISVYSFFSFIWLIFMWPIVYSFYKEDFLMRLSYSFPIEYWFYFILFSVIVAFVPNSLFYKGIQSVEASKAGLILLIEPVVASIVAIIAFSQYLNSSILVGGGLILLSNYLIIKE